MIAFVGSHRNSWYVFDVYALHYSFANFEPSVITDIKLVEQRISRGSVVTDFRPVNLGSTPARIHESLVVTGRASGQNCSCSNKSHILVGTSNP